MKINRKSGIIDDFITRIRNDADKENLLNRSIQIDSPMLSHFNPINRSKYKLSGRKQSLSKRQSTDSNTTRESCKMFAFSQISDITNSSINMCMRKPVQKIKMKQNSHLSIFSELLTDLMRRVDKNQRQIQKIKKQSREDCYDGLVFESNQNRRPSDFKQIKDLYMIIRDQNIIQSQFNKRINDEIAQIRIHLPDKLYCQKFYQDRSIRKTDLHIKQLQSSIKNFNTNQLNNRVLQLSRKYEEISFKIKKIEKSPHVLSQIVRKSDRVCEDQETLGVKIRVSESIIKEDSLQLVCQNVSLYYLDINGYLMDHNKHYLLNQQNNLIQITQDQLLKIKQKCHLIL